MNGVLNKTDLNMEYEVLPIEPNPGVYAHLINLHVLHTIFSAEE